MEILKFLLTIKISYFSGMWKSPDLPLWKRRIFPTFTSFSAFPFLSLSVPKAVHVCHKLTMKFPLNFYNYTGLKGLVNFHQTNWFLTTNATDLQVGQKQDYVRSGCWEVFRNKVFLKILKNSQRNTCAQFSF